MADADQCPPTCPHCGSVRVVPILYGYHSDEGWRLIEAGKRVSGGCTLTDGSPVWECLTCHKQGGRLHIELSDDFADLKLRREV